MEPRTETNEEDVRADLEQILAARPPPPPADPRTRHKWTAVAAFIAVLAAELVGVGALVGFDWLWALLSVRTGNVPLNHVVTQVEAPFFAVLLAGLVFVPVAVARFVYRRLERPPLPF